MKFIKYFLDYIVKIFIKIPVYLRGMAIFFVIVLISIAVNKLLKPEPFPKKGPNYVIENNPASSYLDLSEENAIKNQTQTVEPNNKNNSVKVTVKENLKSSTPKINIPNRNRDQIDENSQSSLTSFVNDYVIGNPKAPVTIIEYSSFKCPYCIDFHKENMEKVKTNYIDTGKVKYIKRVVIQKDTLLGVMLPYCARADEKYSLMNDLFINADVWTKSPSQIKELKKIALENKFTPITFDQCIKDKELGDKLLQKQEIELKELKIYSTPTVFINKQKQKGNMSFEELSKKIDEVFLESQKK